jgi:glycosyltransferase involved in cell wall biosynthesis
LIKKKNAAFNADRLLNRFWDYPKHVRSRLQDFDYFHICDHSYAHLVHELPADRTGVYCHDLDCFRCLLDPDHEHRPRWFRAMSRRILRGMQKAAVVFCSTRITERRILQLGLIDQTRLLYAPYGISPEFVPSTHCSASEASHRPGNDSFLLHVGSCIPRKRIDVLLEVFAEVRTRLPELQLVQVGGHWTGEQLQQMTRLGIASAVRQFSGLDRETLAQFYRQARIVLQPSEAEGFGLPLIEALACGATVVASDIPVLREVGGDAVVYCPVADVPRWAATIEKLLLDPAQAPDRNRRLAQAQHYSWDRHAETILHAYLSKRRAAA